LLKHLFHPGLEVRPERAILLRCLRQTAPATRVRSPAGVCELPVRPQLNVEFLDEGDGLRLAASLLIPIYSIGAYRD